MPLDVVLPHGFVADVAPRRNVSSTLAFGLGTMGMMGDAVSDEFLFLAVADALALFPAIWAFVRPRMILAMFPVHIYDQHGSSCS